MGNQFHFSRPNLNPERQQLFLFSLLTGGAMFTYYFVTVCLVAITLRSSGGNQVIPQTGRKSDAVNQDVLYDPSIADYDPSRAHPQRHAPLAVLDLNG